MKRCREIVLAAIGLLSLAIAWGDEVSLIEQVPELVALEEQVSGSFEQARYISVLPQPLMSRGRFSYAGGAGLAWETPGPIGNRLEFDESGIRQSVEGEPVGQMNADQPAAVTITRVISSVLASDWQALQQYFDIDGQVQGGEWQLRLTPEDEVMAQVVEEIA